MPWLTRSHKSNREVSDALLANQLSNRREGSHPGCHVAKQRVPVTNGINPVFNNHVYETEFL